MSDIVKDYSTNPINNHEILGAEITNTEGNLICGDSINVFVKLDGEIIKEFGFTGNTSNISTASASIVAEDISGKTMDEALKLNYEYIHNLGLEVSPRRKRAAVLPLLAIINGIYKYRGIDKRLELEDLIDE